MPRTFYLALTLMLCGAPAQASDLFDEGSDLYSQICSRCHGFNMVSAGTAAFDLRKFPTDQQARFLNSVSNGKGSMPAMGDLLSKAEIEALWQYISARGVKDTVVDVQGNQVGKKKALTTE